MQQRLNKTQSTEKLSWQRISIHLKYGLGIAFQYMQTRSGNVFRHSKRYFVTHDILIRSKAASFRRQNAFHYIQS